MQTAPCARGIALASPASMSSRTSWSPPEAFSRARRRGAAGLVRGAWALVCGSLLSAACAPGGTYCQTGPKYGTECYAGADLEADQRRQGRAQPPEEWSEHWSRLRAPAAGNTTVRSAGSNKTAYAGQPGQGTQALSVRVAFAAPAPGEPAGGPVPRRADAERYAEEIAAWFDAPWRELAQAGGILCADLRLLSARVELQVEGERRIVGWRRLAERSLADPFEDGVEQFLENVRGQSLPPPPALFPELVPRLLEVELTNRGLSC